MNKGKEIFSGILIILSFAWIGMGIGIVIKSEVVLLSVEGMKNVGILISIPVLLLISIFLQPNHPDARDVNLEKERREIKKWKRSNENKIRRIKKMKKESLEKEKRRSKIKK